MMRFLAGLLALAVAVFVVVNILNKPAYYVCSGTKTPHGQSAQPVQRVGMQIEVYPMLNRLLFRPKEIGLLILDQIGVMDVSDDGGNTLSIANTKGDFRGQFDRINRHLDVFTGDRTPDAEYDMYCSETRLAPV
jgi:hypothetical protein